MAVLVSSGPDLSVQRDVYLHEKAPVLIAGGGSGTGKSHLAQALGHGGVRQGVEAPARR